MRLVRVVCARLRALTGECRKRAVQAGAPRIREAAVLARVFDLVLLRVG